MSDTSSTHSETPHGAGRDETAQAGSCHDGAAGSAPRYYTDAASLRAILRSTLLFGELDDAELDRIAASGELRGVPRNHVLFSEGDTPAELFVVVTGLVAIANTAFDGRESLVALMGPGELFGEMGFLDGFDRSAQARTLETSTVLAVSYEPLRAIYENNPNALWSAVRLLGRRLRSMDQALADAVFLDVMGRTAKRLLELADGADTFDLPVTQEELASMVGASRERVNKAIATFVKLGWITQQNRRYTITDREHLTLRAN